MTLHLAKVVASLTAAVVATSVAAVVVSAAMTVSTTAKLATHLKRVKAAHRAVVLAKARAKGGVVSVVVKVLPSQPAHAALTIVLLVVHAKWALKPVARRLTNLHVQLASLLVAVDLMPRSAAPSRVLTVKL